MSDKIPAPPPTETKGVQDASSSQEIVPTPDVPIQSLPLADTIQGIGAARPRAFGNEITSQLVVGILNQLSYDLDETKKEKRTAMERVSDLESRLSNANIEGAVLKERIRANSRFRHFSHFGILFGTTVFGLGVEFLRSEERGLGYLSLVMGALLIVVSWFVLPAKHQL